MLEQSILAYLNINSTASSLEIAKAVAAEASYSTVKRMLSALVEKEWVVTIGNRKSTRYQLSPAYNLLKEIEVDAYFLQEQDERSRKPIPYNEKLLNDLLLHQPLFTKTEADKLNDLQGQWEEKISDMTEAARWLAFERWMIDLSWKSAQIEGNTYTLLETELLLKEQKTAKGKTQEEATMLLNHKTAIDFILANPGYLQPLTRSAVEDVHSILMKDLAVEKNIRTKPVAITGTNYKPLDNIFQIKEALELLCVVANKKTNMFERAFLLLLMVSYIQPFQDGNKRTARILSNAVLLKAGSCPLSFRTVDPLDYKKALLIFYEQQNISAFKKMWMEQFAFAIETYSV